MGYYLQPQLQQQRLIAEHLADTGLHLQQGLPQPRPQRGDFAVRTGAKHAILPGATTVVVRNVPRHLSQQDFLAYVRMEGLWDYLHLPYNLLHKRLLGYAFINFLSNELAVAFQREWHGRVLPNCPQKKPLDVTTAETQGWQHCLARVKARKVHHLAKIGYLPLIFKDGHWLDAAEIAEELARVRLPAPRGALASESGEDDIEEGESANGICR